MPDRYVDVETVAKAYGVSTVAVRTWCRDGSIRGVVMVKRKWRIPSVYATGTVPIVTIGLKVHGKGGK
jgi:predicted site-specific integrase-resolvase